MPKKKVKKTQSPPLEVISKEDQGLRGAERRNLPRLCLTAEQFRISQGKIFSVIDLSMKGMGFWILDPEDRHLFTIGLLLEGTLNLRRKKYSIQARVRNLRPDRVGCEFENLSPAVSEAIQRLLDPSVLGAELKPIPSSELTTLWYHGPSGTDLLLRRMADGRYQRMTLFVLGSFIQWDEQKGVTTGKTLPSSGQAEPRGILRLETLFLLADPESDSTKLQIAKTVILSSNLPQDLKTWCVRQIERM